MRRMPIRTAFVSAIVLLSVAAPLAAVTEAAPPAQAGEMSLELAFNAKVFPWADKPVLSPDGRFIVFGVFTPKLKSPGAEFRYLPGGTPSNFEGTRLFLKDVRSGRTVPLDAGKGNSWRPVFSPDARLVAYYSDAEGFPQLWVHEVATGKSRRITTSRIKPKIWPGDEPCWTADGKDVYVPLRPTEASPEGTPAKPSPVATDARPNVAVFTTGKEAPAKPAGGEAPVDSNNAFFLSENNVTLAVVRVATGEARIVADSAVRPRPASMRLSPSGAWISYEGVFYMKDPEAAESFFDLAVIPASGGAPVFVAEGLRVQEAEYFGSACAWRPGHDQLVYLKDGRLWSVDLAAGPKPEAKPLAPELSGLALFPLDFAPDGSSVLVGAKPVDDHDYSDPRPTELAAVPMDGSPVRKVALAPGLRFWGVVPAGPRIHWAPDPGTCAVYLEDAATGEHAIRRIDLASGRTVELWRGLARLGFAGATSDGTKLLATYEDARTPVDLYLFSADFTAKDRMTVMEPRFESVKVGPVKTFETVVPSYDGELVRARTAMFFPPSYKEGDACPTIVVHYGGSRVSRYSDRFGGGSPNAVPALLFISRGYAVMMPDLIIGPMGEGRSPARDLVDLLLPQVYRAIDLGYCDIKRMAICGQSYGGYGTVAIAAGTNLFRAAVALDGVYDLASAYAWMSKDGDRFSRSWSEKGQGRMGTHPWADVKRYIDNSPFYQAERIHTPLLMLHGESDTACPVEEARKMFSALDRLGRTAQLAVYAGEGHVIGEWSFVNAADGYTRFLEFLKKYLSEGKK